MPPLKLKPLVHCTVDKVQKLPYSLDRIESYWKRELNTIWQDLLAVVCQLVNIISTGSETTVPIWSRASNRHLSSDALSGLVKPSSCCSSSDSALAGCSGLLVFHGSLWGRNSSHFNMSAFCKTSCFREVFFWFFCVFFNATENYLHFSVTEVTFFVLFSKCYFHLGDCLCGWSPLPNMAFLRMCSDVNTQ